MAGIPQVITEDRASGAQFIDGSLTINGSDQYLTRTHTSSNTKTWTFSCWVKKQRNSAYHQLFTGFNTGANQSGIIFMNDDTLQIYSQGGLSMTVKTNAVYRDSGWMNVVVAVDTTIASPASDRVKLWVNGTRVTDFGTATYPSQNDETYVNTNITHYVGSNQPSSNTFYGQYTQAYFIDGQALGPEEFGYTDPLTNTWRPKKYEGDYNVGPASGLNGVIWSNYITGTVDGTYPLSNCFGGNIGSGYNNGTRSTNPGTLTLSIASLNLNVTNVRLNTFLAGSPTLTVNGTNVSIPGSGNQTHVVAVNGQLNTVAWSYDNSNGPYCYMRGIEVDLGDGAGYRLLTDGAGGPTGVNSFYLPLDGNTPIGKDQSGNGNDWTPNRFGGSVDLPRATGALPILNTNDAGTVAKRGVRTDSKTYTVTASGGNYYLDGALKPTLNAYRGGSYTFDYTGATSHPLYLSSLPDGKHNSKAYSVNLNGVTDYLTVSDSTDFAFGTNDFTVEFFFKPLSLDTSYSVSSYAALIDNGYGSSGGDVNGRWFVLQQVNTQIYTGIDGGQSYTGGGLTGEWQHLALVRHGLTTTTYLDGVSIGSRTATTKHDYSDNLTRNLTIGLQNYSTGRFFKGDISNVRIVNGTALYTSTFTPPWTTLTNVTNTKLLCCQDSNATTSAVLPTGATITANGNAAANNTSPFLYNTNSQLGVNTGTSNITKITIPHHAADTLYYYCNAHSGMGSSINVITDIFKADPYAWKCTLALPCLGNANDVSHIINCNTTELPIVPQANAHADFSTGNFYGGSYDLDGSGDYINVNSSSPYSHVNFGYSDYTAECWVYLDGTGDEYVFNMSTNNGGAAPHWNINFYSTNLIRAGRTNGSGDSRHQITYNFPTNKWMHIAISRGGFTSKLFLDGVLIDSRFDDDGIVPIGNLNIGAYNNGGAELNGFVQDARIYNGVAKYTESFVVGSTAPNVLPDSPSGVSGKSKLTKITDGAVAFDGGDFLQIPASEDLNVGSANFTAEAWVYPTTYGEIVGAFNLNSPYNGWLWSLSFGSLGKQMIWFNGNQQESTSIVPKNKWSHIAFSKSGTTVKYFLDGKLDGSFTASADSTWSNQVVHIGADSNSLTSPGRNFHGFISNLRLIKGTALYTSNFTPPTEPLTEVTNTKLLCCQSTTSATAAAVTPAAFTPRTGGYRFNTAKVYSTYGGGARAANYTVQWSDDNSSWTNAWSGNMSNNTSCGLQQGTGSGNPGAHRYWRYVEGSATTGHHPRVSRIVLSDGITDVNIKVYVADNCSDNGDYQIGTTSTYEDTTWTAGIDSDAAATNFNPFTDDINTIRGQATGYATLNPLKKTTNQTLSDGNLKCSQPSNVWGCAASTIEMHENTGKFYFECTIEATNYTYTGIANRDALIFDLTAVPTGAAYFGGTDNSWGLLSSSGNIVHNTASILTSGAALSAGDTVGMTFDTSNKECKWYVEGRLYYTLILDGNYPFVFGSGSYQSSNTVNFGQKPFKFPPPDGFQPLNLSTVQPEKVIARSDQYVQANIWSGDNTTRNFDIGMKPDFVWIKCRSDAAGHRVFDSVRGPRNSLRTSSTGGQDTVSQFGYVSSFNHNGFTLTPGTYTGYESGDVNMTGRTYVGWTWKAGGSSGTFNVDGEGYATTAAAGITEGNIALAGASVGRESGFSIVTFTGNSTTTGTIGHGLNKKPQFVIVKDLVNGDDWQIKFVDENLYLKLNTTDSGSTSYTNYTATDSVINLGYTWNNDSSSHIAYSWHDVPGLQKFGTFVGNGASPGTFVELGFRPAIVLMKNITRNDGPWLIHDVARYPQNPCIYTMEPYTTDTESSSPVSREIDILSNGFKTRGSSVAINESGSTILYAAWAEAPSINLYGGQSNAR